MFDPRDDARDRDGREDGRARVYDERDRDDDPREGLMRDLDLPRGEERELVAVRDRVYELDGEESRTLAAVGAFRVVPEHDLDIDHDTPEHQLLRQEIEQAVTDTVAGLPEELRQAITLREVDGLSYEEIAQLMQCPIGTVRSRIFRAREAIDERLRPLLNHERVRP